MGELRDMSDDELSEAGNAILIEQERRASLSSIPGQVAALSAAYQSGGGDIATLRDAVG